MQPVPTGIPVGLTGKPAGMTGLPAGMTGLGIFHFLNLNLNFELGPVDRFAGRSDRFIGRYDRFGNFYFFEFKFKF